MLYYDGDEQAEHNTGSMEPDGASVTTANSDEFDAIHGTTRSLTTRARNLVLSWEHSHEDHELNSENVFEPKNRKSMMLRR